MQWYVNSDVVTSFNSLCGYCQGLSIHVIDTITIKCLWNKRAIEEAPFLCEKGDAPNPMSAILPCRSRKGVIGSTNAIITPHQRLQSSLKLLIFYQHSFQRHPMHSKSFACNKVMDHWRCRDTSSETDILCFGKVAEDILGITSIDVIERSGRCEGAICKLQRIVSPGSRCRGTIRSCVKNGKIYFFLKSISCIPNGVEM